MDQQITLEKIKTKKLIPPSKYSVVLHNDDITTMDFVIDVLMQFFGHDKVNATRIMYKIHHEGSAICGIYSAEIAAAKVAQVTDYAQLHNFPLCCTMEKLP